MCFICNYHLWVDNNINNMILSQNTLQWGVIYNYLLICIFIVLLSLHTSVIELVGVAATAFCCSCLDSYCLLLTRFYILVETGDISVLGPCRYNMMGKNLVLSVDIWRYIARYRSILHFLFSEIFFLNKLGLGLPFLLFLSFG